jgi:Ca2+-binding RTX toxin-like protein
MTTYTGTTGNDYLSDQYSIVTNDLLLGLSGDDQLYSYNGNDTLKGGEGNDGLIGNFLSSSILDGGAGDDGLTSYSNGDTLDGGDGNDSLISYGATQLGGNGNDTFISSSFDLATSIIDGGAGIDTISQLNIYAANDLNLVLGTSDGQAIAGLTGITNIELIEKISLGNGNNIVTAFDSSDHTIYTGGGNDTITGGSGNDYINGYEGNNIINGGAGNDTLVGTNYLNGGNGDDLFETPLYPTNNLTTIDGGAGIDTLSVLNLYDIDPLNGFDITLNGLNVLGTSLPILENVTNVEFVRSILAGSGNDSLTITDNANHFISGEDGDDTLTGGGGNDTIDAGLGKNVIFGGAGDDRIERSYQFNYEIDTIDGGAGIDTLAYLNLSDRTTDINLNLRNSNFLSTIGIESITHILHHSALVNSNAFNSIIS